MKLKDCKQFDVFTIEGLTPDSRVEFILLYFFHTPRVVCLNVGSVEIVKLDYEQDVKVIGTMEFKPKPTRDCM